MPYLAEFFLGIQLLPPTLTRLSIDAKEPLSATIFAVLPRNLKELKLTDLVWNDEQFGRGSFPEGAGKSDIELFGCLPPKLESLWLYGHTASLMTGHELVKALSSLPPTLLHFTEAGVLTYDWHTTYRDIMKALPPLLLTVKMRQYPMIEAYLDYRSSC